MGGSGPGRPGRAGGGQGCDKTGPFQNWRLAKPKVNSIAPRRQNTAPSDTLHLRVIRDHTDLTDWEQPHCVRLDYCPSTAGSVLDNNMHNKQHYMCRERTGRDKVALEGRKLLLWKTTKKLQRKIYILKKKKK